MTYEKTIAAALTETKSKFALAEALALDVPPRSRGGSAEDEQSVIAYVTEARDAIVAAGGEDRAVGTLSNYRMTALWAESSDGSVRTFRWVDGVSFTAHNEARMAGESHAQFVARAAAGRANSRDIREDHGRAPTGAISPSRVVPSWSPEQRADAARELLADPQVAEEIAEDIVEHVASDSKRTADVVFKRRQRELHRDVPTEAPESRPARDYDAMVEQWVNLASVTFAAESAGTWKPNEHSEALLYFISQIVGKRSEPTGDKADLVNEKLESLFSEAEAYANSEVS